MSMKIQAAKPTADVTLDYYYHALDSAAAEDYASAHESLVKCVVAEPGNPQFVQALLENLSRWFAEASRTGNAPAIESPGAPVNDIPQSPQEVLRVAPAQLSVAPWNVPLLLSLASACAELGHPEAELLYLERAILSAPKDVAVRRQQAQAFQHLGKLDEAIAAWQHVQDLAPADTHSGEQIAALVVERSRRHLALSHAGGAPKKVMSTQAKIEYANERGLRDLLKEAAQAKRSPIQQLEFAVRDWPANPDLYLKLASLYLEKGREYDAEKLLSKAKELMDDDRLSELWEDVTMARLQHKVEAAQKQLEVDGSEAAILALGDAQKSRDRFQTDIFVARSQRQPDNAALRYELGLRWKQAGKMHDAYECFTASLQDPDYKGLSALAMGNCLEQSGQILEALQYYRIAADSALPEQSACRVDALRRCGTLAHELKLHRLAERYLSSLLETDPQHAQARQLLAEVRGGSD